MKRFATPVFLLLAWAGDTAASGFTAPAAGARLSPGRFVLASFELPRGVSGVEEMELVLSLDGGVTYPLRLTSELDPRTRRGRWRVPALPSNRAVLALRAGDEEGDEQIILRSGIFAILGDPSAPLEDIRYARGEWRTREAGFEGFFPFSEPSLGTGEEERFSDVVKSTELAETRPPTLVVHRHTDGPRGGPSHSSPEPFSPPPFSPLPLLLPLRE